jgi:hypothetical protein
MKKWMLIGAGAIVVVVIVILVVGISNLGPMIKGAVNTYGPELTKTDVKVGDVDVSVFSAEAVIKDFLLGNPSGFKSAEAMKVGSINVDIDEKSLTKDTIIIDSIEVVAPEITYEKGGGSDNFRTILDNVQRAAGSGTAKQDEPSEAKQDGKKIIIRNFIVRDGKVKLAITALGGKGVTSPLPDIHLKDIGKEKDGASPAEIFKDVFESLYSKITSPSVTDTLNKGIEVLGSGADAVGKSAEKGVEAVSDTFKGLLGK